MLESLLLLTAISLFSYAFYEWATVNNDFFKKRNVKFIKPTFLFGSSGAFFLNKYDGGEFLEMIYNQFPDES